MEIKNEHIKEVESLLINGQKFDEYERVPFIKNLESCDLLAVPGSGKTTALLAKLYCISKFLPFNDGSGILVLSHTNAAIDEIENNLKPHCPKLFEYPNFVGTIQSFVNKFLMTPYYVQKNSNTQIHIDADLYKKSIEKYLSRQQRGAIAYYKNKDSNLFKNARFWFDEDGSVIVSDGLSSKHITINPPKTWIAQKTADQNILRIKQFIEHIKNELIKNGVLHYDDCYFLAYRYIQKYSQIIEILRHRFKHVFIDEMQDLENYQIELIDKIFYEKNEHGVIQRIGDINQAIYNSGKRVKVEADWKTRNQIYLNGSNRLTKENSDIVNNFTLDRQLDEHKNPRFVVVGQRPSYKPIIKPHFILFDGENKGNLVGIFEKLIKQYHLDKTVEARKYGFKIIGWSAKWEDYEDSKGRLRLEDIFSDYRKESAGNKENLDCLCKYLQFFDHGKFLLREVQESIINSLLAILRFEGKRAIVSIRGTEVERTYTKASLLDYIQNEGNNCDYHLFKKKIYDWSFSLSAKLAYEAVYEDLKAFILGEFKSWFDFEVTQETLTFIGERFEQFVKPETGDPGIAPAQESINIDIGTVHSAKGQTHCATMYVETSYYCYETQKPKILDALKNENHGFVVSDRKDIRGKEALKMMYVGFSRPTHLLCFAAMRSNIIGSEESYSNVIKAYEDNGWEVVDLTNFET